MQKNSEIRSISLVSIKTRSCLYLILPFKFGIAGKKVRNLMSMIALNKEEKSNHVKFLLSQLWHGQTDIALNYLKHQVVPRNNKVLLELIGYLEKHHSEIINYEGWRKVGKSIGSGRMEKGVDLVVGHRQKKRV